MCLHGSPGIDAHVLERAGECGLAIAPDRGAPATRDWHDHHCGPIHHYQSVRNYGNCGGDGHYGHCMRRRHRRHHYNCACNCGANRAGEYNCICALS